MALNPTPNGGGMAHLSGVDAGGGASGSRPLLVLRWWVLLQSAKDMAQTRQRKKKRCGANKSADAGKGTLSHNTTYEY